MFAACIVFLIHSCYCLQNNFYENKNFINSSAYTVSLNHGTTIELSDACTDGNVSALTISAAGRVDFFPSQQQVSRDSSMRFYPLLVNLRDIDLSSIKHVTKSDFLISNYRAQLFAQFDEFFQNYSRFEPMSYTIVEWRIEHQSNSPSIQPLVNLFQMFFATNGTSLLVVFLYDNDLLQWGKPSMGIDVCGQKWEHPLSSTNGILNNLANGSNINVTGQWMFMIENGELIEPTPCSVGCSFITGTCSEPNTCSCVSGWDGVNCTTPLCPGGCGNGTCIEPSDCFCDEGWYGDNCATPNCTGGCGTSGNCIAPNVCECKIEVHNSSCDEIAVYYGGTDIPQNTCSEAGEYICNKLSSTGDLCHIKLNQQSTVETTSKSTAIATSNKPTATNTPIKEATDTSTSGTIEESREDLSGAAIGGIVAGVIGFVVLIILLVFFIVCVLCCFYS